jgi:hypothetical protein
MVSKIQYVMTQKTLSRLKNSGGNVATTCKGCGEQLKVGDKVVSITRHKGCRTSQALMRSKRRIYHKKCYEEVEKQRI